MAGIKYFTKDFYIDAINNLIFKGSGKLKLTGSSYVVTKDKILVINILNEVVSAYDIEDEFVAVPPTLTSTGVPGQKAYDNTFLYYCVAVDTWIKILPQSAELSIIDLFQGVPATISSTGTPGQLAYDALNKILYVCVGTNSWARFYVSDDMTGLDLFTTIPATLTSSGTQGQIAYDSATKALYVCVATNTWVKFLSTDDLIQLEVYTAPPVTPTSTGSQGQRAYDEANSLMYECVANNVWIRYAVTKTW